MNIAPRQRQPGTDCETLASRAWVASQHDLDRENVMREARDSADLVPDEVAEWLAEAQIVSDDVNGNACSGCVSHSHRYLNLAVVACVRASVFESRVEGSAGGGDSERIGSMAPAPPKLAFEYRLAKTVYR